MLNVAILPTLFAALAAPSVVSAKGHKLVPLPVALSIPQAAKLAEPPVAAAGAICIDAESGKVLWAKDAETPRYMASCTKIMTALLLIEKGKLKDLVTAPPDIEKTGESSMHLKPGEKVSVQDMLYALMLRSANDGCVAAADYVAGSVPKFIDLMNTRAKEIGCQHTHFVTPNGLHDPQHYTSAHDLALIAREAMKNPLFREVVRTQKHKIERSINKADEWMVSRNKWLKKDFTADDIKTGYTVPAGHCYVGSATRDGWRVITVMLNSDHWQVDNQNMLNWSFTHFDSKEIAKPGAAVASVSVEGGKVTSVPVGIAEPLKMAVRKGALSPTIIADPKTMTAPIKAGQELGTLKVRDTEGFEVAAKAVALADVAPSPVFAAKSAAKGGFTSFWVGALVLGGGGYALRRRSKRKMSSYGVSSSSKKEGYSQNRWS